MDQRRDQHFVMQFLSLFQQAFLHIYVGEVVQLVHELRQINNILFHAFSVRNYFSKAHLDDLFFTLLHGNHCLVSHFQPVLNFLFNKVIKHQITIVFKLIRIFNFLFRHYLFSLIRIQMKISLLTFTILSFNEEYQYLNHALCLVIYFLKFVL